VRKWPSAEAISVCKDRELVAQVPDLESLVGITLNFDTKVQLLNGLRHPIIGGSNGWYLWSGEEFPQEDDAFKSICIKHLFDPASSVLPFLCLPPGWRFLKAGDYIDIWFDEALLEVE